ncbi:MAG: alpha/beta fold hydrolase [Chloroflexi bacterium]|nr:MAG: alpha/beta fold hydrolase [Chloroflexota bacterium]
MDARRIVVHGLRIRVLEEDGGGRGDPIVLIHALGGWAENWRAVMAPLAATGRRVIALDLPGFGESERPKRVRYFGPDEAFYPAFVLAAMEALGIERAHVAGNSMGGAVAFMTAVTAPPRVSSLVLVAPGGLGRDVAFFLRACALPGFGLLAQAIRYGEPSFPEFVRALAAGVGIRGVRRSVRDAWISRAPQYGGPALIVWGREDRVLPVAHLDELRDVLARAEVHVIERCGHIAMAERPEEFLRVTLPFLARAEQAVAA